MKNLLNELIKEELNQEQLIEVLSSLHSIAIVFNILFHIFLFNLFLLFLPSFPYQFVLGSALLPIIIISTLALIKLNVNANKENLSIFYILKLSYANLIKDKNLFKSNERVTVEELVFADKDNDYENILNSKIKTLVNSALYQIILMENLTDKDFNRYKEKGYYDRFNFTEKGEEIFKNREEQYIKNIMKEKMSNF